MQTLGHKSSILYTIRPITTTAMAGSLNDAKLVNIDSHTKRLNQNDQTNRRIEKVREEKRGKIDVVRILLIHLFL